MKTKDRLRNQPPLSPPYPRRGILGLPASDEEGVGVVGLWAFFAPWRETGVLPQKRGTPENLERDVFSWKRTQSSSAYKGLNIFRMHKTNCFFVQTNSKRTPKRG